MPFVINPTRRGARAALALAGTAAVLAVAAAPAQATMSGAPARAALAIAVAQTATPAANVCTMPSFDQVFAPWRDKRLYTLSPGGDFEGAGAGWRLAGGAELVPGNEPFHVGGFNDATSLSVPTGATVVSAPMCIDRTYPSFRFFARNAGSAESDLKVDVLWWESGAVRSNTIKLDKKAGTAWAPVRSVRLPSGELSGTDLEPVVFRFSVTGTGGAWQVDDLYVDPWARR